MAPAKPQKPDSRKTMIKCSKEFLTIGAEKCDSISEHLAKTNEGGKREIR
jgi:hypothetical protein